MSDQIEAAAAAMIRDYTILAFLISLGSLQIAVSISGIRGLWLLPNRILTRYLGIVIIILGLGYYILSPLWVEGPWAEGSVIDGTSQGRIWGTASLGEISGARNINDIHGGMAGTGYAGFFVLGAILATLFATIMGVVNTRLSPSPSRSERDARGESITREVPDSSGSCSGREGNNPSFSKDSQSYLFNNGVRSEQISDGLDALKDVGPYMTLRVSLYQLRRTGGDDIRQHMRSSHRWSVPAIIERMWRN